MNFLSLVTIHALSFIEQQEVVVAKNPFNTFFLFFMLHYDVRALVKIRSNTLFLCWTLGVLIIKGSPHIYSC